MDGPSDCIKNFKFLCNELSWPTFSLFSFYFFLTVSLGTIHISCNHFFGGGGSENVNFWLFSVLKTCLRRWEGGPKSKKCDYVIYEWSLMECLDNQNIGTNFRKYTFIMNFENRNLQHAFFWISFYSTKTKSRFIMETVQSCLSY